jgi:hemolysin III
MKRTKLRDRSLPGYSHGEELFNMISHIVGAGLAGLFCAACVIKAFLAMYGGR